MEQMETLLEMMEKLPSEVNVDAAFGEPEKHDDLILIPVAEITYGYGIGFGKAEGSCCADSNESCCNKSGETAGDSESGEPAENDEPDESCRGMGGAGGIGAKARPLGYIEIGPDGTKVKSIVDEQKVALAGILLVGWTVAWIGMVLKAIISPHK